MRLTRLTLILIAGILALGFYRLYDYLLEDLEFQTFQATEEAMVDAAHLFASAAEANLTSAELTPPVLESFEAIFQKARERTFEAKIFITTKTHVSLDCYLTDHEGIVIFDSQGKRTGQDYSQFNDVYQTRLGNYGARSTRVDEEDATTSIMYIGAPIHYEGRFVGVATVYKPQKDLLPFVYKRRAQIMRPTIAIALAVLFLIGAVLFWLYRPIGRLADYARSISVGDRPPYPELGKGQEVNALGSALKEMRETLEGRSYIENYTQTLTHELKSPLAAIRGAAELLDEEMSLQDRHRFLTNIRGEVDRSERLINRLLHLAALEGKTELQKLDPISLNDVLTETITLLRSQIEMKNIVINFQPTKEKLVLLGDFYIIRAAVENLLQNALEFAPEASAITIILRREEDWANIQIADAGPGLPDYALEKAFDRFFSHRPADCGSKGSGLGLTFVREAANLHRGEASIANRPDGGAIATLRLPLESHPKRARHQADCTLSP